MSKEADSFEMALATAMTLPFVHVSREKFLKSTLHARFPEDVVKKAIDTTPKEAGITADVLRFLADDVISYETTKVTAVSTLAGIPGGFAMLGTVPADTAQYLGHMLRVVQKLAYLYGWEDFSGEDGLEDGTKQELTIFLGVMFGIEAANAAIHQIAKVAANGAVKKITAIALTKTWYYPLVKKIASVLSVKMTKQIFAKSVSKMVPLIGGGASGLLTYASFKPMSKRLKNNLASLGEQREKEDVIIEFIDYEE